MKKIFSTLLFLFLMFSGFSQTYFSTQNVIYEYDDKTYSAYAADLNEDGYVDVVSSSWANNDANWFKNQQNGSFSWIAEFTDASLIEAPSTVYAADLNNDGYDDILLGSTNSNTVVWFQNDGSGNFSAAKEITDVAGGVRSVFAVDLDGDGWMDVLSALSSDDKIVWYKNQQDGTFSAENTITSYADSAMFVYSEDIDGDNDFDVVSASWNDNKIAWYENLGDGSFSSQKIISAEANGAQCAFAIDLDKDGDVDILSAAESDDKIAWYENDGTNNFSSEIIISSTAGGAYSIFATDLDKDGDVDILAALKNDSIIAWYENDGYLNFTYKEIDNAAYGATSVFAIDFDNDGDKDILGSLNSANKTVWYKNKTLEILNQPQNRNDICAETTININITAKDADAYQWKVSTDGYTFTDISDDTTYSGATTDTLRINFDANMDNYRYYCQVSNSAGYKNSDTVSITKEIEPPLLSVQNDTLFLDNNGNATLYSTRVVTHASDNCSVQDTVLSKTNFDCSNLGDNNQVTITLTDNSGNQTTDTIAVSVYDIIKPDLTSRNDTLYLDENGNATLYKNDVVVSASDNCSVQDTTLSKTNFDCSNLGDDNLVTITLTDNSGNQTTDTIAVSVYDIIKPNLTSRNDTLYLDENGNATLYKNDVVVSASDNCSVQDTVLSKTNFDCSNLGANTVTITLTDNSGNQIQDDITVMVYDTIKPNLSGKNANLYLNAEGNATLYKSDVIASASDNCSVQDTILSKTNFDCSNLGENTITITLTDNSENQIQENIIVTVYDTVKPVLLTQDALLMLDANGNVKLDASDIISSISDNCGISDTLISKTDFDCSNAGDNDVTITVTDVNGNQTVKTVNVKVEDAIVPSMDCLEDKYVAANANHVYVVNGSEFDPTGVSDNCGVDRVINNFNNQSTLANAEIPEGSTTIEWAVYDKAGNMKGCLFVVNVSQYTGINDLTKSTVKIYPNPTTGLVTIDVSNYEKVDVEVIDVAGKTIFQKSFNEKIINIDLSGFEKGVYYVKIKSDKNTEIQKVVKN